MEAGEPADCHGGSRRETSISRLRFVKASVDASSMADSDETPIPPEPSQVGSGFLTAMVWTASVVSAAIAFTVWATIHLGHFGQGCPLDLPNAPDPTLAGALAMGGAIFAILLTRRNSHSRFVLFFLVIAAMIAVVVLEALGWWGVGVNHSCSG